MKNHKKLFIPFFAFCAMSYNASAGTQPLSKENSTMAVTTINPFDLNTIYNADYQYSLPRKILEGFASGVAFDNKTPYSQEELQRLAIDANVLFQKTIPSTPVQGEPIAVISAGAPGAGKTTLLEQYIEKDRQAGKSVSYVDPDAVCLKEQKETFLKEIAEGDGSFTSRKAAYDKWRPASNFLNHWLLGHLIKDKQSFYFGTTSSAPQTALFLDFLKKNGYKIEVIHVVAPDAVRWASIQERDKSFVQTTEEDTRIKGDLLPQRITDTFLKYADTIRFHYRDAVTSDATLAAIWTRNLEGSTTPGTLQVIHPSSYDAIKKIHNTVVETLQKPELLWESAVENTSTVSK